MINTRDNNDVIDHTSPVYTKNDTELSRPIESSGDCDENQTTQ